MNILCPHCQFSKQVSDAALPPLPTKATCPQCSQQFTLEAPAEESLSFVTESAEQIVAAEITDYVSPPTTVQTENEEPAGFWLRVLAAVIDSIICNAVVFVMGFGIGFLIESNNYGFNEMTQLLIMAMGIIVTLFYYIFFTGYGGQTPGKMALQIKVIHNDGSEIGYGQAFVRETIGKIISYLLLCIGYLMVGLRRDKRGLHDLLASTRVIKL
ncbi:MAG: hypothetical protein B6I37_01590 [Desulfobacteraceae bacterium 4572_35.2]|nr:MAG: hypothetical protein B6I37_01590 [Desulfobacteraceae bacterium 4572_35.2]